MGDDELNFDLNKDDEIWGIGLGKPFRLELNENLLIKKGMFF